MGHGIGDDDRHGHPECSVHERRLHHRQRIQAPERPLNPWQVTDFEILKKKDNQIVATNPGQFYQHASAWSMLAVDQPVSMTAKWPYNSLDPLNSFVTEGATPVHCYQQLAGSTSWSEVVCAITINASTGTAPTSPSPACQPARWCG